MITHQGFSLLIGLVALGIEAQRNGRSPTATTRYIVYDEAFEEFDLRVLGPMSTAQVGGELAKQRRDVAKRPVPVRTGLAGRTLFVGDAFVVLQGLQSDD